MDEDFSTRLLAIEADILNVLSSQQDCSIFHNRLTLLFNDLRTQHESVPVSDETLVSLHNTISRLGVVLETFEKVETDLDHIESTSIKGVDTLLSRLNINGGSIEDDLDSISLEEVALNWLLFNLADPYPSEKQQREFCKTSGANSHEVQRWFKKTRRSIGWTTLCQHHFNGSKKATTTALRAIPTEMDQLNPENSEICALYISIRARTTHMLEQVVPLHQQSQAGIRNNTNLVPVSTEALASPIRTKRKRSLSPAPSSIPKRLRSTSPSTSAQSNNYNEVLIPHSWTPALLDPPKLPLKRSFSAIEAECLTPDRRRLPPHASAPSLKRCLSDSDNRLRRERRIGTAINRTLAVSEHTSSPVLFPDFGCNPWEEGVSTPLVDSYGTESQTEEDRESILGVSLDVNSHDAAVEATCVVTEETYALPSELLSNHGLPTTCLSEGKIALSPPLDIQLHSWTSLEDNTKTLLPSTAADLPLDSFLLPATFDWLSHPISDEPCPELDYSSTPSSVADSLLPDIGPTDLSEKLRKLQEHQEAAKKLEAEISAAAGIVMSAETSAFARDDAHTCNSS